MPTFLALQLIPHNSKVNKAIFFCVFYEHTKCRLFKLFLVFIFVRENKWSTAFLCFCKKKQNKNTHILILCVNSMVLVKIINVRKINDEPNKWMQLVVAQISNYVLNRRKISKMLYKYFTCVLGTLKDVVQSPKRYSLLKICLTPADCSKPKPMNSNSDSSLNY